MKRRRTGGVGVGGGGDAPTAGPSTRPSRRAPAPPPPQQQQQQQAFVWPRTFATEAGVREVEPGVGLAQEGSTVAPRAARGGRARWPGDRRPPARRPPPARGRGLLLGWHYFQKRRERGRRRVVVESLPLSLPLSLPGRQRGGRRGAGVERRWRGRLASADSAAAAPRGRRSARPMHVLHSRPPAPPWRPPPRAACPPTRCRPPCWTRRRPGPGAAGVGAAGAA